MTSNVDREGLEGIERVHRHHTAVSASVGADTLPKILRNLHPGQAIVCLAYDISTSPYPLLSQGFLAYVSRDPRMAVALQAKVPPNPLTKAIVAGDT